ncbi:MAG: alanyl-tRNA editing protein, partial [Gammaproteobacteria bacterium]|nr:alanyl-tRNA editing protein [Gammaproteobacteria bacterium]
MTEELFRKDSYLKECDADVTAVESQAVAVDRTVFYPLGGGQPGDTGSITWPAGNARIIDTRYGDSGEILHVVEEGGPLPPVGETVHLQLDWERRYRHMRMHTAMHLLGAVLR